MSTLHPGSPAPPRVRTAGMVVLIVILTAVLAVAAWLLIRYWPYEGFIIQPIDAEGQPLTYAQLEGEFERDAEGLPVLRAGAAGLQYRVGGCNPGYDVRIERWFDAYGSEDAAKTGSPMLSYLSRVQEANVEKRLCPFDSAVPVVIPNDLPPGTYRLRIVYQTQAAATAPVRTEVTRTEPILIVE